ncbi:MAG: energy transducer TonB [Acidobacteriia bacterium]|nr:energy transducer TonB [Terriglobia bacterium]
MFDDLVESTTVGKKSNTGWGMIVSAIVQCLILGILILIPLIYTQALPKAFLTTLLVAPPPPPPPPPPVEAMVKVKPIVKLIQGNKLLAPRAIPKEVTILKEAAPPPDLGVQGGMFTGLAGQGIMVGSAALPPPPKPVAPARIKQGGNVTAALIINQTRPVYPPLARQARIQGSVILHAIIDKDGKVAELQVVSGHPLLVQAALDAVKQWLYKPTLLNGDPVEVDTTITVTFSMGG